MIIVIKNEIDIYKAINLAKEQNKKLTISATMNADNEMYTSKYDYIQLKNHMNKIIEINTINNYIIVESGITWIEILEELDKINYTLYTTQSGLSFSVGGSFCGNAHGRKTHISMVKDTIEWFKFIDGMGNIHKINIHDDVFNAFPGSLGLLGFITEIKIKILPKYDVILDIQNIPKNNESINYIHNQLMNPNVCMINFQTSYFDEIPEILLSVNYYSNIKTKESSLSYDKTIYTKNLSWYYTIIIIIFSLLSNFNIFDKLRWNIEAKSLYNSKYVVPKNINNAFDNWSRPYLSNFRIIEFFFPQDDYLYCQKTIMNLFRKHNMAVLSSGSRIVFEVQKSEPYLRFSYNSSKSYPYFSLVVNYIQNDNINSLTNDIRKSILERNIKMTYHTTYNWPFSLQDINKMFPGIHKFILIKQKYDKYNIFSNHFSEKYLSIT